MCIYIRVWPIVKYLFGIGRWSRNLNVLTEGKSAVELWSWLYYIVTILVFTLSIQVNSRVKQPSALLGVRLDLTQAAGLIEAETKVQRLMRKQTCVGHRFAWHIRRIIRVLQFFAHQWRKFKLSSFKRIFLKIVSVQLMVNHWWSASDQGHYGHIVRDNDKWQHNDNEKWNHVAWTESQSKIIVYICPSTTGNLSRWTWTPQQYGKQDWSAQNRSDLLQLCRLPSDGRIISNTYPFFFFFGDN